MNIKTYEIITVNSKKQIIYKINNIEFTRENYEDGFDILPGYSDETSGTSHPIPGISIGTVQPLNPQENHIWIDLT